MQQVQLCFPRSAFTRCAVSRNRDGFCADPARNATPQAAKLTTSNLILATTGNRMHSTIATPTTPFRKFVSSSYLPNLTFIILNELLANLLKPTKKLFAQSITASFCHTFDAPTISPPASFMRAFDI